MNADNLLVFNRRLSAFIGGWVISFSILRSSGSNAILTPSTPDFLDSHIAQGYQGEALAT
jgi:hypothetical protein